MKAWLSRLLGWSAPRRSPPKRESMPEIHQYRNRVSAQQGRSQLLAHELEMLKAESQLEQWLHDQDEHAAQ